MGLMDPSGGLSGGKLALANASIEDVLSGKTFYSGGKLLRNGTMPNKGAWKSTVNHGGSITIPKGYHNGGGSVTTPKASITLVANSTGRIASGTWNLDYSHTFNAGEGYNAFVVIVVARNLSPLYNTSVTASSGSVSEAWLRAIAMEDDRTYDHAKTFMVNNVTLPCTIRLYGSGGSGWGYIIYGIK